MVLVLEKLSEDDIQSLIRIHKEISLKIKELDFDLKR